jgi:hypothetical protein
MKIANFLAFTLVYAIGYAIIGSTFQLDQTGAFILGVFSVVYGMSFERESSPSTRKKFN